MTEDPKKTIEDARKDMARQLVDTPAFQDVIGRIISFSFSVIGDPERQQKRIGDRFSDILAKLMSEPVEQPTSHEWRDLIAILLMKEMAEPAE